MYEIEKGIEVPDDGRGRTLKYPWKSLEIGDSFFVIGVKRTSISGSINHAQKRYGLTLTSRIREENGVKGVRVWRIE